MNSLFHSEKLQMKERLPFKQVFGYLSGMVPTVLMVGFFGFAYSKFFLNDLKQRPLGGDAGLDPGGRRQC